MQISDVEIARRLDLLALTRQELNLLSSLKSIIDQEINTIVEKFYSSQLKHEEIALLIGDSDTLNRLRIAQKKYILDLFSGHCDSLYVNNRLRIGMVHKRIGVEPKLYLAGIRSLKEILNVTLDTFIEDIKELTRAKEALDKLLYFDTALVFDTYIDSLVGEIVTAKKRTEIYAESLEQKVAERTRQLEEEAKLDPLTSIFNPRAMYEVLRKELAIAERRQTRLCLIYFDIDKFKAINDRLGHIKGDEVLKHVARVLQSTVRKTDTPCRYGGDEFCLILPECGIRKAKAVCKKIINIFSTRYPDYSLSMGIAETGPEIFIDGDELLKIADTKMYAAKKVDGSHVQS